nr:glycosyltransferase [Lactobacillus johnsonii]
MQKKEKIMKNQQIPKVINYFWFGGKDLPPKVKKCIKSWEKYCPDYELKLWNETNFDINCCSYVREAYDSKKWAFVSDYARFWVLYNYGGIYLDTDVELIKSLDNIIKNGPFFALETEEYDSVNPGVGMASQKKNVFYKEVLDDYENSHYLTKDGIPNNTPVGKRVARLLKEYGLSSNNSEGIQVVDGIYIYPAEYFCPLNYFTGELHITDKTVAIHHFQASWLSESEKKYHKISQHVTKLFGKRAGEKFEMIIKFPYSFNKKRKKLGLKTSIKYYLRKYK